MTVVGARCPVGKPRPGEQSGQLRVVDRRSAARGLQAAPVRRGILPFTILRRLDCILEPSRVTVRALAAKHDGGALDVQVRRRTGPSFYNTSEFDFAKLLAGCPTSSGRT